LRSINLVDQASYQARLDSIKSWTRGSADCRTSRCCCCCNAADPSGVMVTSWRWWGCQRRRNGWSPSRKYPCTGKGRKILPRCRAADSPGRSTRRSSCKVSQQDCYWCLDLRFFNLESSNVIITPYIITFWIMLSVQINFLLLISNTDDTFIDSMPPTSCHGEWLKVIGQRRRLFYWSGSLRTFINKCLTLRRQERQEINLHTLVRHALLRDKRKWLVSLWTANSWRSSSDHSSRIFYYRRSNSESAARVSRLRKCHLRGH